MDAEPDPSGPQHLQGMKVGGARERPGSPDPARAAGRGDGRRFAAGHGHGGRWHGQQPRHHVREGRAAGQFVRGHADGVGRFVALDGRRGMGFTGPRAQEQYPGDDSGERAEGRQPDGARKAGACGTPPSCVLPAPHGRRW